MSTKASCPNRDQCSCSIWRTKHEAAMALYDLYGSYGKALATIKKLKRKLKRVART